MRPGVTRSRHPVVSKPLVLVSQPLPSPTRHRPVRGPAAGPTCSGATAFRRDLEYGATRRRQKRLRAGPPNQGLPAFPSVTDPNDRRWCGVEARLVPGAEEDHARLMLSYELGMQFRIHDDGSRSSMPELLSVDG